MPKIFQTLDKIRPVYDWTYKIVMLLCKLLLVVDILITCMSVAGRYIPFIPDPAWTEQMVLTLMVYMAVLSATLAIRSNTHIRMTVFDAKLPKNVLRSLDLLSDIAVMVLGVIMLVYGMQVCNSPLAKFGKYESIPTLSRVWMYMPIPLAGVTMIIFELEQVYLHIKAFFVSEDAAKEGEAK